ncbi:MAG: hypothetical protein ABFR89_11690 [Actinomycetota bacterium]
MSIGAGVALGPIIVSVVLIILAMAVIWAVLSAMRTAPLDTAGAGGAGPVAQDRLRPILVDFHVRNDTAEIYYGVPLPEGDPDPRLRDLLCHDASLVLHEKKAHGLPIAQVVRAKVFAQRGPEAVQIGMREFEEPGEIPEVAVPELTPHAQFAGHDPLAHLGEQEFDIQPGVASREPEAGLPDFHSGVTLAGSIESQLRASGVDPTSVSLHDLALALFRIGGYETLVERAGISTATGGEVEVYTVHKAGSRVLVAILEHNEGEHPELSERLVNAFVVEVAQRNPQRAMLITDKFGPYLVYEKERSDPRCRFITRERLQAFVDSFALQ